MFWDWKREPFIRKTLRAVARQRVVLVAQPGNVLVVERAPDTDSDDAAAAMQSEILSRMPR